MSGWLFAFGLGLLLVVLVVGIVWMILWNRGCDLWGHFPLSPVPGSPNSSSPTSPGPAPTSSGVASSSSSSSALQKQLGIDIPIKAVYLGYAANVSDIVTTVTAAADAGFNIILLAFWMGPTIGVDPYSAAYYWSLLPSTTQQSLMQTIHAKNAFVLVSAGGAGYNDYPVDGAAAFGQGAAIFSVQNNLDGVDFDFEHFTSTFGTGSGMNKTQTLAWLQLVNSSARTILGDDRFITHAPQSPYFNIEFAYGYLDLMTQDPVPSIDHLLIQYYNQGATYLTYDTQFIDNSSYHPGTTILDLLNAGIPKQQLVIGRLTQAADGQAASWIDPTTLGQWFVTAATDSRVLWKTGFSTWQWHSNGDGTPSSPAFITAVYPP